jgi:hypothetical protein
MNVPLSVAGSLAILGAAIRGAGGGSSRRRSIRRSTGSSWCCSRGSSS